VDEWLADRLGMAYTYSRVNGHHENGFEEGLAVFSRYPLGRSHLRQLTDNGNPFVRRLALGSEINTPCGGLLAFSVHLSLMQSANARQLESLRDWVGQVAGDRPALIGGDFNADERKPQIHRARLSWLDTFRHLNAGADGTTHELRAPLGIRLARRRLDYIFFKPGGSDWQVLESRHLSVPHAPHSDHHAVLTRLTPAVQPA
jgi:endonuclease/exonuclease/phosphatase family metal-dependent hydrolase